jgi:formylglycine-generating enzyme required for sulfatase activity/pimeloyl-ACP methyl ester carboxylesterase
MPNRLQKLRELSLWQVAAIYVGTAWVVLQATDLFINRLHFPAWLFTAVFVLLAVGLPVVMATAVLQQRTRLTQRIATAWPARAGRLLTWRNSLVVGVLAFAALGLAGVAYRAAEMIGGNSDEEERAEGLAEFSAAINDANWEAAWRLMRELEPTLGGDSAFEAGRATAATRVTFNSEPAGASVYHRFYTGRDTTWQLLGVTPLVQVWFPNGTAQLRIERNGYRTLWRAGAAVGPPFVRNVDRLDLRLDAENAIPVEMVRIPGGMTTIQNPPLDAQPGIELSDFLMDRYEVTNREYKRFVDAGGYQRREYWKHPFVRAGRTLTWQEGMHVLVDRTGRAGPSTWEAGDYPDGDDDLPVSGVSWYEAAAYAEFSGKALPTVYHWSRAASTPMSEHIVPRSNFAGRGPRAVSASQAIGWYGTFDQAGNVREWCANANGEQRYIMGGGWTDPMYHFNDAYSQPPLDRSSINGIRLVRYQDARNLTAAADPIALVQRNFRVEQPVSDQIFAVYRSQFAYDRKPLNEKIESVDSTHGDWVKQRVSFNAAYLGPRMLVDLYIPKRGQAPYQVVIFFPPGNALQLPSSNGFPTMVFDFLIKSGRVLAFPIYRGTFERGAGSLRNDYPAATAEWRDYVVMWGKDYRRTFDYLESRPDLDAAKTAFYGLSWGGALGVIMAAIEPRTKAVILNVGGLNFEPALPEVDQINYVPRVTQPTLMLNGRYDHFFPVETSQTPLFVLLGTPRDQKRHVIFEGGHLVPRPDFIRETLGWLDRYLGPVTTGR